MTGITLAGGPTQDEIMAVSLFKLGLRERDTLLEIGCGTGKVSIAAARTVKKVFSIDKRPEAIRIAGGAAEKAGIRTIEFSCTDATEFLMADRTFDCAFVGGTQQPAEVFIRKKSKRTIGNAVLVSTPLMPSS
jgi:cobalt-precorrin-6B (C15)-methyltransferase